jgi:arylsulfatase B
MAPDKRIERILDFQHGDRGRLTYDCTPKWWLGGACLTDE